MSPAEIVAYLGAAAWLPQIGAWIGLETTACSEPISSTERPGSTASPAFSFTAFGAVFFGGDVSASLFESSTHTVQIFLAIGTVAATALAAVSAT
jgi:hypothetical protein